METSTAGTSPDRTRSLWWAHATPGALVLVGWAASQTPFRPVPVLIALLWMLLVFIALLTKLDPLRPRAPKRVIAKLPPVRREPPKVVPVIASRCVICGRPLTNQDSMVARVGSTCIKTYGPRPAWRPNPDHDRWAHELARAHAQRASDQVRLDAEHAAAQVVHAQLVEAWEAERESPAGVLRRSRRVRTAWVLTSACGWFGVVGAVLALSS